MLFAQVCLVIRFFFKFIQCPQSGSEQPKRTTPAYSSSKIELRGGSRRTEGNVFVNGKPVCDDMWDKKDATVACRMLGFVYSCN